MAIDPKILANSKDSRLLSDALDELAQGQAPADQAALADFLSRQEALARLDGPPHPGPSSQLRIARVLRLMMDNSAAHSSLVSLTQSPEFNADVAREELLVQALAEVRPAPPQAVTYWDRRCHPDSTLQHYVAQALCDNGSPPAVALLEKKLADPALDPDDKILWMRKHILVHRQDVPLLQVCQSMLQKSLPDDLKPNLVEALFDYRPGEWYRTCAFPEPPSRLALTREARDLLLTIGQFALDKLQLSPDLRVKVEATMRAIKGSKS